MSEYTDIKNRKHKIIQTIRETKESRDSAEREIVEELFKIFFTKVSAD